MTCREAKAAIDKLFEEHLNSNGDHVGFSLGKADDDAPFGFHNLMVTATIPIRE